MAKASHADSGEESDSSAEVERGVAKQTSSSSKKPKSSSVKTKNATPPSPAATDDGQAGEEEEAGEDDDEEVYEIERIVKAEMGHFQPGVHGYFVHWKGYPPSEDSWVNEPDAEGAMELINEFWKKHKKISATKARKSGGGHSLPEITPARKSASSAVDSEELAPASKSSKAAKATSPKTPKSSTRTKRSRVSDISDKMDVDEVDAQPEDEEGDAPPPPKRKAPNNGKSQSRARASTTKSKLKVTKLEDSELTGGSMHSTQMSQKYEHLDNWEDIVSQISTVERDSDNKLQIYWVSTAKEECLTPAETFKHKAPILLINFYESNLRWRPNSTQAR